MEHHRNLKIIFPISCWASIAFFLILWALDYPKPMEDDLYYTGAALHMAAGGDFSNPLIERQAYASHFFFVYPPFHSYALLGWFKVFGISRVSMTGFPIMMYAGTACALILVLRKNRAPKVIEWLIPLGIASALMPAGLRAESLAVALTMIGLAFMELGPKSTLGNLIAFFLMALGASTAPRLAFFAAALIAFSALKLMAAFKNDAKKQLASMVMPLAGMAGAAIIFLVQIHFHLREFWRVFHDHAQLVSSLGPISGLIYFMNQNPYLNGTQSPLVWAWIAMIVFAWPQNTSNLRRLALAFLFGFIAQVLAGGLGAGGLCYIMFGLLFLGAAVINSAPVFAGKLTAILAFLFVLANGKLLAFEYLKLRGRISDTLGDQAQKACDQRPTAEYSILIDSHTARYLYDYRIPEGFQDIQFSAPFPKSHIIEQFRPNDLYIIGPINVDLLNEATSLNLPVKKRVVFSLPNGQFITQPRRVYFLSAEDCRPRTNTLSPSQ